MAVFGVMCAVLLFWIFAGTSAAQDSTQLEKNRLNEEIRDLESKRFNTSSGIKPHQDVTRQAI